MNVECVSIRMYADDISLLASSERDLLTCWMCLKASVTNGTCH